MKKSILATMILSLAFAGYSFMKSSNVSDIMSQNVEALTYILDDIDIYPSADGYYYTAMYYRNPKGSMGIYMDVTQSGTQTETPYKMQDSQGHIAYKCSVYREKVGTTESGHCFAW